MQETQEMQVQSLGREDPLEKGMATHSSILTCKIPWTEEPGTHTQTEKRHSKSRNRLNMLSATDRTSRGKNDKNTQDFNIIIYQT